MWAHSPRASPWESSLPWAPFTLSQSTLVPLDGGGHAHGSVCAKGVAARTSRGAGISATVRSPNVSARSVAGKRRGGRPDIASPKRPKPATPRPNACAADGPKLRPRRLRNQKPRHRVVTQQNFFPGPICDRPGCYEPPATSPRNPARYCGPTCRHALHNVLDRERKWFVRGTLEGRKKRAFEYQAGRQRRTPRRRKVSALTPSRAPPE
jgi:hypothetical protein